MNGLVFDFIGNLDTLLAVLVGALLATGGALVAEIIQDRLGRKRRERDAARFFGEIMVSMDQIFDLACRSQGVGEPWGAFTQRMFDLSFKEGVIYERNRERVFEINDMDLRFAIHGHMLRMMTTIDSCLERSREIDALERQLNRGVSDDAEAVQIRTEIEDAKSSREGALAAAKAERQTTGELLERLAKIGKVAFEVSYA